MPTNQITDHQLKLVRDAMASLDREIFKRQPDLNHKAAPLALDHLGFLRSEMVSMLPGIPKSPDSESLRIAIERGGDSIKKAKVSLRRVLARRTPVNDRDYRRHMIMAVQQARLAHRYALNFKRKQRNPRLSRRSVIRAYERRVKVVSPEQRRMAKKLRLLARECYKLAAISSPRQAPDKAIVKKVEARAKKLANGLNSLWVTYRTQAIENARDRLNEGAREIRKVYSARTQKDQVKQFESALWWIRTAGAGLDFEAKQVLRGKK